MIRTQTVAVTTTGSAGSATGSGATAVINGRLLGVYLDFGATAPASTDTTIAYTTRGGNIIVVTDSATDVLHLPRKQASDAAASGISGVYDLYPIIDDSLTVSVAGSNALAPAVTAYIYWIDA